MESFQSILTPVRAAYTAIERLHRCGDCWAARGVPPHITIAGPWPLSIALPMAELSKLAQDALGTRYQLSECGMLGDAVCLFPLDDSPLLTLRNRVLETVGTADSVDAHWRFHLTISRSHRLADVSRSLAPVLPLACELSRLHVVRVEGHGPVTLIPI